MGRVLRSIKRGTGETTTYQSSRHLLRRRAQYPLRFPKQRVPLVRWVRPQGMRRPLQGLPCRSLAKDLDGPERRDRRGHLPKRRLPLAVPKTRRLRRRRQAGQRHHQDLINKHNLRTFLTIILGRRILFLQYSVPLFLKVNALRWTSIRRILKTSNMNGALLHRRRPRVRTLMEFFNVFYLFLFILHCGPGRGYPMRRCMRAGLSRKYS